MNWALLFSAPVNWVSAAASHNSFETFKTTVEESIIWNTWSWQRWIIDIQSLKNTQITIRGNSLTVTSSSKDIQTIKESLDFKRKCQKYTHFYSLPLNLDLEKFLLFQQLAQYINPVIPSSVFVPLFRTHLTVCMLGNLTRQKKIEALQLLNGFNFRKFTIKLNSLGYFGADAAHATVLYAKPQECVSLDKLGLYFMNRARRAGISDYIKISWHCTLINAKYGDMSSFDASRILEFLSGFDFGSISISEVHLSCITGASLNQFFKSLGSKTLY